MNVQPIPGELLRYYVKSSTRDVLILVDLMEGQCSCEDHQFRQRECKHLRAVQDYVIAENQHMKLDA